MLVSTNLKGKKNQEMLESVIGQMSDGIWEECLAMRGYWGFVEIKMVGENVMIEVEDKSCSWEHSRGYLYAPTRLRNRFYGKSGREIREFFANKLKQIVKRELEDNYDTLVGKAFMGNYQGKCCFPNQLVERYYRLKREKEQYLKNHPFSFKGKFNASSEQTVCYLGYEEEINIGDVYQAYKTLRGE